MATEILIFFFGILISAFLFWRRLKEDYSSEIIFNSIFIIYSFLAASFVLSKFFYQRYFFWMEVAGAAAGLFAAIRKNKTRFFETLEALCLSLAPLLALFFLNDSVRNYSIFSFFGFIVILGLILIFYFVDMRYKTFIWYKSGKIGLSGLTVLFLFFLIRGAIAIFFPSVLSFSGGAEPYLSGLAALVSFVLIIILGRDEQ